MSGTDDPEHRADRSTVTSRKLAVGRRCGFVGFFMVATVDSGTGTMERGGCRYKSPRRAIHTIQPRRAYYPAQALALPLLAAVVRQ